MLNPAYDPQNLLQAQQLQPGPIPVPTAVDASGVPVAVPSTVTTTTQPVENSSTTQVIEGPKLKAAEAGVQAAAQGEREAVQAKTGMEVAKEAIGSQGADAEAAQRAKYEMERDALKASTDARIAQSMAEQKAAREAMRGQKSTTYMEDLSPIRKALTALSLGFGAYGASMNGGPNTAFQIYQSFAEADKHKKEAALQAKASRLADATGDITAAQDFMTKGMLDIQNRELARLGYFKSTVEAQMKRVPQAAVAGQETLANIDKAAAAKELEQQNLLAAKHTKEEQGQHVSSQITEGKDAINGGRNTPNSQDMINKSLAEENGIIARRIKELRAKGVTLTPSEIAEIRDRENVVVARQSSEEHSPVEVVIGKMLRGVDAIPDGMFPEKMSEDKKELFTLGTQLIHTSKTKEAGQSFWGNPVTMQKVLGPSDLMRGESQKLIEMKLDQAADKALITDRNLAASKAAIAEKRTGITHEGTSPLEPPPALQPGQAAPTAAPVIAPAQTPAQKKYADLIAKQIAADKKPAPAVKLDPVVRTRLGEALRVKPGDPDFAEAQAFIRKATAASRAGAR